MAVYVLETIASAVIINTDMSRSADFLLVVDWVELWETSAIFL